MVASTHTLSYGGEVFFSKTKHRPFGARENKDEDIGRVERGTIFELSSPGDGVN